MFLDYPSKPPKCKVFSVFGVVGLLSSRRQIHAAAVPPERVSLGDRVSIYSGRGEILETRDHDQTGPETRSGWHAITDTFTGPPRYPGSSERPQRERSRAKRCLHDVQVRIGLLVHSLPRTHPKCAVTRNDKVAYEYVMWLFPSYWELTMFLQTPYQAAGSGEHPEVDRFLVIFHLLFCYRVIHTIYNMVRSVLRMRTLWGIHFQFCTVLHTEEHAVLVLHMKMRRQH